MRYIFASHDRASQVARIKDVIAGYRNQGAMHPEHFQMHPVYDDILGQLADHFLGNWKDQMALLGLGGYGRREMSPYSDIDLLFLRPENAPEGVYRGIRSLLYLLWDARVELGHSVRTVKECLQEGVNDLAVLTSLMDIRLVWGNEALFRELMIQREPLLQSIDPLDLYLRVEAEIRKSSDKFGHTIYLLEPHLKEGPGSLRYIQLIGWLIRMIFGLPGLDDLPIAGICGPNTVMKVKTGRDFLAEVRTRIHFLAGRRDDRLKFDAQPILAEQMGFVDSAGQRGVEAFMREYYRHASTMDFFGRRVLARARLFLRPKVASESETKRLKLDDRFYIGAGGIYHYEPETFGADWKEMLLAFKKIAESGCDLDIRLVDIIRDRLSVMEGNPLDNQDANRLFLDIFRFRGSVAPALNAMMKTGILERCVTEFSRIRFLPRHDLYHQYTVDLHTMKVLEDIDSFASSDKDHAGMILHTVFSTLENPEVLYLAGLFHDVGKGRGSGHEIRGEIIAREVLNKLGLIPEHLEEVSFLIRNHLAMNHLAFKKDLHDVALLSRFAETIMSKRRLDMLLLLTCADLRGVGPSAFNSWNYLLLEELYYRTLDVIQGEALGGEDLTAWIRQIKATIWELVPVEYRGQELQQYLEVAGSRYFLDFNPEVIADHFTDLRNYLRLSGESSLGLGDVIARKVDHRGPGYSAISLITRDRSGLFFRIAGTLSANRINILSAWSHSIGDIAVATYHVNDIPEGPLDDESRWERFQADLARVLQGEADVDQLVAARRASRGPFQSTLLPRLPLKVEIDNAASDRATIVEVYAHDRPGLLYDISRQLTALDLYIILTKITTEVDQAADIFYVQDGQGNKILDFERLNEIRTALHDHLVAMEEQHFTFQKEAAF
ncbi:MAG TPA: [protein-PII] uridylyltransferase [Desulfomonilaceae bacterium]|nr:[protein-PII] uridylyltransferase [Desulfomonilaceae bacterium]